MFKQLRQSQHHRPFLQLDVSTVVQVSRNPALTIARRACGSLPAVRSAIQAFAMRHIRLDLLYGVQQMAGLHFTYAKHPAVFSFPRRFSVIAHHSSRVLAPIEANFEITCANWHQIQTATICWIHNWRNIRIKCGINISNTTKHNFVFTFVPVNKNILAF